MAFDLIPYHKMRVLIIEDLAEMRSTMKSILANLGVQTMETVNSGEEALNKLSIKTFDIIFSDYELGRGKDGQQILEEARQSRLIPASTTYIMVTAAQTAEMVMGVLEFEPDGYIAKPVTLEIVRTRLNRIIRTKNIYREINKAIDKGDTNGALEACNRLALEKPQFSLPAFRIKGKLLIKNERYEEALELYDTVLSIKKVAWAVLGIGKTEYLLGHFDKAKAWLEGLAQTNSRYVEAFDWLSKVLEAQGQYKAAQSILEKAINESPKSVLRQQELARLAELNSDAEALYKASRKAYALAKNSVFRNPDLMLRYALALQPTVKLGNKRDQKIACSETDSLLAKAREDFELTAAQNLKITLIEAQSKALRGETETGQAAYEEACALAQQEKLTLDQQLDVWTTALLFEEQQTAMEQGDRLLQSIGNQYRLQTRYYNILDFHLSQQGEARLALLEKRGRELLQNNLYEDAYLTLKKSLSIPQVSTSLRLLTLNAFIQCCKQGKQKPDYQQQGEQLFQSLNQLPESDPEYSNLEKLRIQWHEYLNHDQ